MVLAALGGWSCSGSLSPPDASSGGTGGAGGAGAGGTVEFRLEAAAGASGWFIYNPGCAAGPAWLSIYDAASREVVIANPVAPCCTHRICGSCQFDIICTTGWTQDPLPVTRTWDATMFPHGTCGGMACVSEQACVPAGSYHARMCASRNAANQVETRCVDVPFALPQSTVVTGVLVQ